MGDLPSHNLGVYTTGANNLVPNGMFGCHNLKMNSMNRCNFVLKRLPMSTKTR